MDACLRRCIRTIHPITRGRHAKSTTAIRYPGDASLGTHRMANQLHRQTDYHEGKDLSEKPYSLFRMTIDGRPVQLR
jgi:hypothetical protein